MKLKTLHDLISRILKYCPEYQKDELEVSVKLSSPSVGGSAVTKVANVVKGIDWDSGKVMIITEERVSVKRKEEDVFDASRDLLMYLATKPAKRMPYEVATAQKILNRFGYSYEEFEKYRNFFHPEKKIPPAHQRSE